MNSSPRATHRRRYTWWRSAVVVMAGLIAAAQPVGGQVASALPAAQRVPDCLSSIPADALARVAVFATVYLRDSTQRALRPAAMNLVQTVADRVQALLGAAADVLPEGEPAITWRGLGSALLVTAFRDGHVTWAVHDGGTDSGRQGSAGARLLDRALSAAQAGGEAVVPWPAELTGDSAAFFVWLTRPWIDASGAIHPLTDSVAVPVFSVAAPREEQTAPRRGPTLRYPKPAWAGGASGVVILEFYVDTLGRPEKETIREMWPGNRPRPTGPLGDYYAQFLEAARTAVADARYAPHRIGGCPVREFVTQPFHFNIK